MRRRHRRAVIHPYVPGRSRCFFHTEKLLSRTEGRHHVLISPLRSGQGANADASIGGVGIIGGAEPAQRSRVRRVRPIRRVRPVHARLRLRATPLRWLRYHLGPLGARLCLFLGGTVVPFTGATEATGLLGLLRGTAVTVRHPEGYGRTGLATGTAGPGTKKAVPREGDGSCVAISRRN